MTDSQKSGAASQAVAPPAAATPKKGKAKAVTKGEKKKVTGHPTSASMVLEAITKLADKKGTSLSAIKKSIADTHNVDLDKQGIHIKKAIKKLVENGQLTQLTGKGAAGSFKLAVPSKPAKKDVAAEKQTKAKTAPAKKPVSKKVVSPKKKAVVPKAKKEAKPAATKKPASAKKATSTAKKTPAGKNAKNTAAPAKSTKPAKGGKAKASAKAK